MKIKVLFHLCIMLLFFSPKLIFAQDKNPNQFVTIVNPIRISIYSSDPKGSLAAQYLEVKKRELPATWLFNYDVLSDSEVMSVAQTIDKSQELGIFLEITPKFASDSRVIYNKTDSWHRANSVFLSGYTQQDRLKLIDQSFEKFKQIFGFYPKSVGAWWVDSYSLEYMQKKYGIIANLTVADQFATDGYEIWGQYWSTPFYPNKFHAGIPAGTLNSKLDIVTIQWAARDPLNGYGRKEASLFSTQDYLKIDYFQKLVNLYSKIHSNKFGQITMGLEGDFPPNSYGGFFADQLDLIKRESNSGSVRVVTMKDFSLWYRSTFPDLSPAQIIETDDLLDKKIKTVWYQSPNFRINLTYDYDTKETKIRDFRSYHINFQEPYFISPNRDLNLSINIPSEIDSASNPDEEWMIFNDKLENIDNKDEKATLNYKEHKIKFTKDRIEIEGDIKKIPESMNKSPLIETKKSANLINFRPRLLWNFPKEGLVFRSLTQEGSFFIKQRKVILFEILITFSFLAGVFFISKSRISLLHKFLIIGVIIILIIGGGFKWYLSNSKLYFVPQSELDALNRLKLLPGRKVVVYNKVCLQCSWHTPIMPAVFANKRDYVGDITGKKIVYNSSIFNVKTRPEAKRELDKLNADYIYLVRFENYVELAPFSPGDLNIEEIYSNANSQIWKIKKS